MSNNEMCDILTEIQKNQVEMMNLLHELKIEVFSLSKREFRSNSIGIKPIRSLRNAVIFAKRSNRNGPMVVSKILKKDCPTK